ncbi:MAG: alpha/beta hydrolase [Gammaproteobacteria bacterium]|nr:alpha/beta hydrolase [Gammaproteobacteria bacterium]
MRPLIILSFLALGILLFLKGQFSAVDAAPGPWQASDNLGLNQIQTLPGIEFVEINTPSPTGQPKQLILFVHGTPGSLSGFLRYLNDPILQDRYHMISVTRPGWVNGDDDKVPSLEAQAKALKPLLAKDQSGLGTILMGHSFGGPVIAAMAMQYPELVAGLAFIASTGDPKLSGPRWYNRFAVVLPKLILGSSLKGANAEIMSLRVQLEKMLPKWRTLEIPVLVVQGDRDRLVHPRNADFLVNVLENADVTYLERPGIGHFVLWQESDLIRDALLDVFAPNSMIACEGPAAQLSGQAVAAVC